MSCLFDSMYSLFTKHGIYFRSSHILRLKISSFMKDNPNYSLETGTVKDWVDMVAKDMNTSSESYIRGMSLASTWGGAMEMAVMSKIFNIRIVVVGHNSNSALAEFDCTSGKAEAIFTLHWTGTHYTPVSVVNMISSVQNRK